MRAQSWLVAQARHPGDPMLTKSLQHHKAPMWAAQPSRRCFASLKICLHHPPPLVIPRSGTSKAAPTLVRGVRSTPLLTREAAGTVGGAKRSATAISAAAAEAPSPAATAGAPPATAATATAATLAAAAASDVTGTPAAAAAAAAETSGSEMAVVTVALHSISDGKNIAARLTGQSVTAKLVLSAIKEVLGNDAMRARSFEMAGREFKPPLPQPLAGMTVAAKTLGPDCTSPRAVLTMAMLVVMHLTTLSARLSLSTGSAVAVVVAARSRWAPLPTAGLRITTSPPTSTSSISTGSCSGATVPMISIQGTRVAEAALQPVPVPMG